MNFTKSFSAITTTLPVFLKKSEVLVSLLQQMPATEIRNLMKISGPLASKTKDALMEWNSVHTISNARPAIFAFDGDVYDGLEAETLTQPQLQFASESLFILSGLYGILRPTDLMQAYRLELGIQWETHIFKNLYVYWKDDVHSFLQTTIKKNKVTTIINLASVEYFKLIDFKNIETKIITPTFYEVSGSKMKTVALFAKRARGMMASFIIRNNIQNPKDLQSFTMGGYQFLASESQDNNWIFAR